MKRPALLLAALAASGFAFAEPPAGPPHGGRGGPPIERLVKDLGLDASQTTQVQAIFEQQRAKHEQADADLRTQLAAVLTAEQLAKFDALPKRGRGGPRGGPPGQEHPAQ